MKRIFSLLLIALLLLVPTLAAHAEDGRYIYADDGVLTAEELETVNARAVEIANARGVGVYYFLYDAVEDVPGYTEQFAKEHVTEENALVLGIGSEYYYFLQIGPIAKAALPDDVCSGQIWEAYRAVKGDPERKLLTYLNAVDAALGAYYGEQGGSAAEATPDYIALTDGGKPTLVDRAKLLTESQAETLSKRLKEIGSAYRCDVVVVTVEDTDYQTPEQYAEDFFEYGGYGYGAALDASGKTTDGDGILLLLSMKERDFHIATCGYAITAFTDYGIQKYLEPQFLPFFKVNDYNGGFGAFADGCEYLLKTARAGEPLDVYTVTEKTAGGKPVIADQAGLLSTDQVKTLSKKLREIGDKYQCDVILVTDVDASTDGDTYAAQYYRSNGYGYGADGSGEDRGGILVYYSPVSGQLSAHTEGFASKAFKGRGLYQFRQALLSALYQDDFRLVGEAYAAESERYLNAAQNGRAINPINVIPIVLGVIVSGLLAFIPVNSMKKQLTDVGKQTRADSYMEPDSFLLTQNSDVLLGTSTSRSVHVVQTSSGSGGGGGRSSGGGGFHGGSSTHTSSGGSTFGGHGGKF
jgi:uncharacterized protein